MGGDLMVKFMVKIMFAVVLTTMFVIAAIPQTKTSQKIEGLVGPVHTVTATNFTLTKVNDIWLETSRRTVYFITFDENGNDSLGSGQDSPQSPVECARKYNDKGQEIERDCMDHVRIVKMFFSYDAGGHVIDESQQDANGKLNWRHTFTFDDKGNMTSLGQFDSGNKLTRKLTWSFDEKGNRTEWTESLLKGEEMVLFEKIVSSYDDKGNVLTQTQYGNPEGMTLKQFFSYEFDTRGNWIRKESSTTPPDSSETQTKLVELRIITYYER